MNGWSFSVINLTTIDIGKYLRKCLDTMSNRPFYEQLSIASSFTGARAQRLAGIISEQGDALLEAAGSVTPARCVSIILFLNHNGPSSLVEIARALNEQHQLTAHRVKQLEALSIVTRKPDPNDQRRRTFHLTQKGRDEVKRVETSCHQAGDIFEAISDEIGFDLNKLLDRAYEVLDQRPMTDRVLDQPNVFGNSRKILNQANLEIEC